MGKSREITGKMLPLLACAVAVAAAPAALHAQGLGIGARIGTVGIGVDGALALGPNLAIRVGLGLLPFEPTSEIDDVEYTLELPRTWTNVGVDVYVAGPFRIGGGVLFRPDDVGLRATPTSDVEFGDATFTPEEVGTIVGTLASRSAAPYAVLGLGRLTELGVSLFLDAGVAFMGDPQVTLSSVGGTLSDEPVLESAIAEEVERFEEDAGAYLRFWPFLSIGVKLGVG